ncbi:MULTISPECIES: recombination regulator RecX [Gracilibacillus]|uniref:Regulatory protein RecX n=1 Tax=Gracilibacillus dipsosauri TaxID=178340 RepID=A0A317KTQ1_9BACI|nr:recombination regulator RecX [Gracilibacillus dipsosauri]PWU66847.1 recombination regulator RecX [Gracilibacillus dipsosauri]
MPTISKITVQKKQKYRYNIFLKENDKEYYAFSVDEDLLISYHLRKGMELTKGLIDQIQEKDASYKVYTLSIRFLSYRMRSEQELIEYLQKKDIEITYIKEVVQRLKRESLLDDLAFSEAFVRTRIQTTSKGPILVRKELKDKGVEAAIIDRALELYTYDKQFEKTKRLIEKKMTNSSKKSFKQQLNAVKQNILQKGFTLELIHDVLQEIDLGEDAEAEYQAVVYQGQKIQTKYQKKDTGYKLKQKVKAALYRKGFDGESIQRFIDEYMEEDL